MRFGYDHITKLTKFTKITKVFVVFVIFVGFVPDRRCVHSRNPGELR
jgi:hypothetical protein